MLHCKVYTPYIKGPKERTRELSRELAHRGTGTGDSRRAAPRTTSHLSRNSTRNARNRWGPIMHGVDTLHIYDFNRPVYSIQKIFLFMLIGL